MLFVGILLGVLLGAGGAYWGLMNRLKEEARRADGLERQLADMEQAFQNRVQDEIQRQQSKLTADLAHLKNQRSASVTEIGDLKSQLAEAKAKISLAKDASASQRSGAPAAAIPLTEAIVTAPPPEPIPVAPPVGYVADPWGEAEAAGEAAGPPGESGQTTPKAVEEDAEAEELPEPELVEPELVEPELVGAELAEPELPEPENIDHEIEPEFINPSEPETPIAAAPIAPDDRLVPSPAEFSAATRLNSVLAMKDAARNSSPLETRRLLKPLGQFARDPDPAVRRQAIEALGQLRSVKALPFLRQGLRDADMDVVQAATEAIAPFKGRRVKPLQNRLKSKQPKKKKNP